MKDIKEFILEKAKIDVNNILNNIKIYYDPEGDPSEYIEVVGHNKTYGFWKSGHKKYFLKIEDIKEYANKKDLFAITDAINKRDRRRFTYSLLSGYDPNYKLEWRKFAVLHRQEKECEWNEELANKFLNK